MHQGNFVWDFWNVSWYTSYRELCIAILIVRQAYRCSPTTHAQRQFRHDRQCVHELESLGKKKRITIWNERAILGAFVYQNGPERAELPEWTTGIDLYMWFWVLFLCTLLWQSGLELPQKMIKPRNMQFMYRKMDSTQWGGNLLTCYCQSYCCSAMTLHPALYR